MRQSHSLSLTAIVLVIAASCPLAFAQATAAASQTATQAQYLSVLSPLAATQPLQHHPLASSGAIVAQPSDWKAANAAVAEFARGHGDVLKWEKSQKTATQSTEQAAPVPAHAGHEGRQ